MRLIDADSLKQKKRLFHTDEYGDWAVTVEDIDNAPTIDAIQVVRCKDCKHMKIHNDRNFCDSWYAYMPLDYFCKDGERKDK